MSIGEFGCVQVRRVQLSTGEKRPVKVSTNKYRSVQVRAGQVSTFIVHMSAI